MRQAVRVAKGAAAVLGILTVLALAGCISGRSEVTYGPKGPAVGCSTLRKIECGRTSKEWLFATLGEPTRASLTPDGTEILAYEYTKKINSDFDLFLILDLDDEHEERTTYIFELQNGVVTKYWRE